MQRTAKCSRFYIISIFYLHDSLTITSCKPTNRPTLASAQLLISSLLMHAYVMTATTAFTLRVCRCDYL